MKDLPCAISKHKASHRQPQQHASVKGAFLQSHEDREEDEDGAKMLRDGAAQENQRPIIVWREVGLRTWSAVSFVTRIRFTDGFAARRTRMHQVV